MVVVLSQVFGQFVSGVLVAADDPVHDPRLLEQPDVAVGRALRQAAAGADDLGDGEGPVAGDEGLDDGPAVGRVPLTVSA